MENWRKFVKEADTDIDDDGDTDPEDVLAVAQAAVSQGAPEGDIQCKEKLQLPMGRKMQESLQEYIENREDLYGASGQLTIDFPSWDTAADTFFDLEETFRKRYKYDSPTHRDLVDEESYKETMEEIFRIIGSFDAGLEECLKAELNNPSPSSYDPNEPEEDL